MKSTLPTVTAILYDLLSQENPHVVVVLGSSIDASEIPSITGSSGFNGFYQVDVEGYEPGMFIIFRPMFVNVSKLPSPTACINVLIEVTALLMFSSH